MAGVKDEGIAEACGACKQRAAGTPVRPVRITHLRKTTAAHPNQQTRIPLAWHASAVGATKRRCMVVIKTNPTCTVGCVRPVSHPQQLQCCHRGDNLSQPSKQLSVRGTSNKNDIHGVIIQLESSSWATLGHTAQYLHSAQLQSTLIAQRTAVVCSAGTCVSTLWHGMERFLGGPCAQESMALHGMAWPLGG